ncbi:MAG: cation diffusion facilitator family transporter [Lawsonella sp.]|nr:cation transporter [Mycobacteriales bacterium]
MSSKAKTSHSPARPDTQAHDHSRSHSHSHGHGHHHHHHEDLDELARTSQWRIGFAIGCGVIAVIVQVIVGIWAGSLALLSDSAHVFTDVFGLIGAFVAIRIGMGKPATKKHTFGFRRVEVLAAGFNAFLLLIVAVIIVKEAISRLMSPVDVMGLPVAIVATVGLLLNFFAFLVMRGGKDASINVKGAYLEVLADMIGSVGVLISGLITYFTGWVYVDIVVAVLIAVWVLPRAFHLLKQVINVILQATPEDVDVAQLREDIMEVDGVEDIHHFHVWSLTTGDNIGSVHVVSEDNSTGSKVQRIMEDEYGLGHVTVQVEKESEACEVEGNC